MSNTVSKLDKKQKQHFAQLVAGGLSLADSYRQAFPVKSGNLAPQSIRTYAWQLYTDMDIKSEVEHQKAKLARVADKAMHRLDEIITEGKEHNALEASKFVYEQNHGKATQRLQVQSQHVSVTYNLGGADAGEIPQEVLDELGLQRSTVVDAEVVEEDK